MNIQCKGRGEVSNNPEQKAKFRHGLFRVAEVTDNKVEIGDSEQTTLESCHSKFSCKACSCYSEYDCSRCSESEVEEAEETQRPKFNI